MCHGRGEVVYQQSFLQIRRTCSQCGGRGQIVRRPCTQCRGERQVRTERKLKVTIPAGVDSGTHLKLAHEGQSGFNGGPAGDLYVVIKVKEHPIFERQGDDLLCIVPINLAQAALGTADQSAHLRRSGAGESSRGRSDRLAHPSEESGSAALTRQRAGRPVRASGRESPRQADARAAQALRAASRDPSRRERAARKGPAR